MSDVPRQPPPKKEVALALLEESSMFIHLDPRRPDVLVPRTFMGQPQLVLQVGLNMAIPIPDLKIDDGGLSCTLSFNRSPFWCRIPWTAIYALVGEDGRGGVWPDDVPPEIQQQKPSAPPKGAAAKKARPKLTAVGARARDESDKTAGPRALSAVPGARRRPSHQPPSDDGIVEAEPVRVPLSAVPSHDGTRAHDGGSGSAPPGHDGGRAPKPPGAHDGDSASGSPDGDDEQATRPDQPPPGSKKPKREIPPYLRVIK
jgi:Stringent starvation protein B